MSLIDAQINRRVMPLEQQKNAVHFPITCKSENSQQYFDQGLACFHSGDTRLADWCFDQVRFQEPECAMAWWGLAIANSADRSLGNYFMKEAVRLQDTISSREQQWVSAYANYFAEGRSENDCRVYLTKSLDRILTAQPDNIEAAAFLVRQFIENQRNDLPIPFTSTVAVLLDHLLRRSPQHPAHFYKILLWDEECPLRAITSADWVRQSLPNASVALSAAGQLFANLDRYDDATACFSKSLAVSGERMRQFRICPGDLDGFDKNLERFAQHLLKLGRTSDAVDLAIQIIKVATVEPVPESEDDHDDHADLPPAGTNLTIAGQKLLLKLLVDGKAWQKILSLESSLILQSDKPEIQIRKTYACARANAALGQTEALNVQISRMQELARELLASHALDANELATQYLVREYLVEFAEAARMARRTGRGKTAAPVSAGMKRKQRVHESAASDRGSSTSVPEIWKPLTAPHLSLPDRYGKAISLQQMAGKPVVLIFYLGAGCPHCIEQLQTFAPLKEEYDRAGITVLAISTDSVDGLQNTFKMADAEKAIPFLLASDDRLDVFRSYGAYDTRRNEPLHGTFLIDPAGRILWQNTSVEPFMATRELLAEAKRILKLRMPAELRTADSRASSE